MKGKRGGKGKRWMTNTLSPLHLFTSSSFLLSNFI
jgi:hypothetical protein